jgi:hypothetical protein
MMNETKSASSNRAYFVTLLQDTLIGLGLMIPVRSLDCGPKRASAPSYANTLRRAGGIATGEKLLLVTDC